MRVRAFVAVALTAFAAALATGAGSVARAEPDSSSARVLDQTYACAVFYRGGAYVLDARAHTGTRRKGAWARLPYAGVRTGVFSGGPGNLVAWVTAGKPVATTMIDQDYDSFEARTWGTVGVRREGCRRTSAAVPLIPAGLQGGSAPPLGDKSECLVAKQVVVRLRAVLAASGSLRSGQDFQTAHVPIREARLAVRTTTGKPLVYADVVESGRARLFTASGCTSE
jgi:hypothetical protein